MSFKSLPNDKILDSTKFYAFADNKTNVIQMLWFVLDRVQNIVGKGKMLVTSIFSFPNKVFRSLMYQAVKLEALECLYDSTGLIFL